MRHEQIHPLFASFLEGLCSSDTALDASWDSSSDASSDGLPEKLPTDSESLDQEMYPDPNPTNEELETMFDWFQRNYEAG